MGSEYNQRMRETEVCAICGQPAYSKYKGTIYCVKHWTSMQKFGQPYGKIQYTKKCHNTYINYPEYNCYAVVENVRDPNTVVFTISQEDFDFVKNKSWYYDRFYINTAIPRNDGTTRSIPEKIHNLLMNPSPGNVIDHKNRNKLDNRRENLRECTKIENDRNKIQENNKSKIFRGVRLSENGKKYQARLKYVDKEIYLGTFETKEEAIEARLEAEKKYYGEFAPCYSVNDGVYDEVNRRVHEEFIDKLDHSNDDNLKRPFYFIREKDFAKYDNTRTDGNPIY